jgi:hypothetical protein
MAWTCACEYSKYYPMNMNTGQCDQNAALCQGGRWQFPCVPDGLGGCKPPSVNDVKSDPQVNGRCFCQDVKCMNNSDCVTKCQMCTGMQCEQDSDCQGYVNCGLTATCNTTTGTCVGPPQSTGGVCANQRPTLDSSLGIPTCTTDLCVVHCGEQSCVQDTDCALACRPGATCNKDVGKCVGKELMPAQQGRWIVEDTIAPYVYGTCHCPTGCVNTGLTCHCGQKSIY